MDGIPPRSEAERAFQALRAALLAGEFTPAERLLPAALRGVDTEMDPDLGRGLAFAFLAKALARHAVTAWEGVGDAAGKPLPLSPEAVERLMDLDEMASAFWECALLPIRTVAAEGNA